MKYIVIYNKSNGASTSKVFTTTKDSFEFFWKHSKNSPMITSDNLMGTFSFRDIQGFKSREEGKKFAYQAFINYTKEMRR